MTRDFLNDGGLPLQLRLDCLDVATSIRPAARILVHLGDEAEKVCTALLSSGIAISVAKGLKQQPKSKQVTVHDWFDQNASSADLVDMAVLYIAKDQLTADSARSADETKDDALFGKALGYPICCVEWVCRRGRVPEIAECLELYAKNYEYDPFPWPGAMLVDAALTPHYPCSVSCEQSISIARERVRELERIAASAVLEKLRNARRMVYWTNKSGVFCASFPKDFRKEDARAYAVPKITEQADTPLNL
jgi:hypothetical protein